VTNKKIYFSFCNDSNIDCSNISKDADQRGAAILRDEDTKECVLLTTPNWNEAEVTYVNNKLDRSRDYLRLSWEGQEPCPDDGTRNLGFSMDVICTDATDPGDLRYYYSGGYSDGTCQIRTVFESKLGCAIVSYREVFEFLSKNYYIFGTILIVLGILLLLFGFRLLLVSLFLGGVVTTVLVAAIIAFQFIITKNTEQYVLWIILGIALVLGCIVGYALVKFKKGGIFILAAIAGLCIALILNSAVFRYAQSKALFWVVIGA